MCVATSSLSTMGDLFLSTPSFLKRHLWKSSSKRLLTLGFHGYAGTLSRAMINSYDHNISKYFLPEISRKEVGVEPAKRLMGYVKTLRNDRLFFRKIRYAMRRRCSWVVFSWNGVAEPCCFLEIGNYAEGIVFQANALKKCTHGLFAIAEPIMTVATLLKDYAFSNFRIATPHRKENNAAKNCIDVVYVDVDGFHDTPLPKRTSSLRHYYCAQKSDMFAEGFSEVFSIIDAKTWQEEERLDMAQEGDDAGSMEAAELWTRLLACMTRCWFTFECQRLIMLSSNLHCLSRLCNEARRWLQKGTECNSDHFIDALVSGLDDSPYHHFCAQVFKSGAPPA